MRVCTIGVLCAALALSARADEPAPAVRANAIQVPYRLTTTNHVLVRAKINGKGPFNFILDTGAPALFVATRVAEKAGVTAAKGAWSKLDRFELEGGLVIDKAEGKIDDIPQLEGMNGLGLAGAELHGVIGYNLLARYRIEFDFTRDKLAWTPLAFDPPALSGRGGTSGPTGLELVSKLMTFMGGMMGLKPSGPAVPRGFLGAELADGEGGLSIRRALAGGPAALAGLRPGDRITALNGRNVTSAGEAAKVLATLTQGAKLTVTYDRDGKTHEATVELGRGL